MLVCFLVDPLLPSASQVQSMHIVVCRTKKKWRLVQTNLDVQQSRRLYPFHGVGL